MELINDIYKNEVPFNSDLLNSTDHEEKYTSAYKKIGELRHLRHRHYLCRLLWSEPGLAFLLFYDKSPAEKMNVQETFDRYTESFQKNSTTRIPWFG